MAQRRIINIVNFIRYDEPRVAMDLFKPLAGQMTLLKQAKLPATWLLQFDALVAGPYREFLQSNMPADHEAGLWFEINRMHCGAAGVPFRGANGLNWDYHAQASLSVGYTPAEREKLADAAMQRFNTLFGFFPRSVAAWYIDAHTLGYLHDKYKIAASANCKEQFGTDGYTLWGGPYAGAYFPSRRNAMLPASSQDQQIGVPVFRMLGADPIHQYDLDLGSERQGVLTLEPVEGNGGSNPHWVDGFLDIVAVAPCLAFGYAQAGQENSFGWPAMEKGYAMQVEKLAQRRAAGQIEIATLADAGTWFQQQFMATPAQAVTALSDTLGGNRRSIWYQSRRYRANIYLQDDAIRFRDIHVYDDGYAERYLCGVCTEHAAVFDALPVLDGLRWSTRDHRAWATPMLMQSRAILRPLRAAKNPTVIESGSALRLEFSLTEADLALTMLFEEEQVLAWLTGHAAEQALGLELRWAPDAQASLREVHPGALLYRHNGFDYAVSIIDGTAERTRKGVMLTGNSSRLGLRFSKKQG